MKKTDQSSMVAHICNFSTGKAKAGGWRVQGQPWLHGKTLSQKTTTTTTPQQNKIKRKEKEKGRSVIS
jgi:hypothetical protein